MTSGCAWIDQLSARNHLNRGVKAYSSKNYEEAIEHFEQAIEGDPELTRARLYLAISYRAQYIPQGTSPDNIAIANRSINGFEEVLSRSSRETPEGQADRATALANLAGLYSGMGNQDEAKEWYRKRLEEEPNNRSPCTGLQP